MKTVNQLITAVQSLRMENKGEDMVRISLDELYSLTRNIIELKAELDAATKSVAHQRNLASAIYAQALLECDKNTYKVRV